jgi:hypothetical protein
MHISLQSSIIGHSMLAAWWLLAALSIFGRSVASHDTLVARRESGADGDRVEVAVEPHGMLGHVRKETVGSLDRQPVRNFAAAGPIFSPGFAGKPIGAQAAVFNAQANTKNALAAPKVVGAQLGAAKGAIGAQAAFGGFGAQNALGAKAAVGAQAAYGGFGAQNALGAKAAVGAQAAYGGLGAQKAFGAKGSTPVFDSQSNTKNALTKKKTLVGAEAAFGAKLDRPWTQRDLQLKTVVGNPAKCFVALFRGNDATSGGGVYQVRASWYVSHPGGNFGSEKWCGKVFYRWVQVNPSHASFSSDLLNQRDLGPNAVFVGEFLDGIGGAVKALDNPILNNPNKPINKPLVAANKGALNSALAAWSPTSTFGGPTVPWSLQNVRDRSTPPTDQNCFVALFTGISATTDGGVYQVNPLWVTQHPGGNLLTNNWCGQVHYNWLQVDGADHAQFANQLRLGQNLGTFAVFMGQFLDSVGQVSGPSVGGANGIVPTVPGAPGALGVLNGLGLQDAFGVGPWTLDELQLRSSPEGPNNCFIGLFDGDLGDLNAPGGIYQVSPQWFLTAHPGGPFTGRGWCGTPRWNWANLGNGGHAQFRTALAQNAPLQSGGILAATYVAEVEQQSLLDDIPGFNAARGSSRAWFVTIATTCTFFYALIA